jgi:hypothetical protein
VSDQTEVHNRLAGGIVGQLVRGPLESGGDVTNVMVLTESVLVGVALACIKLGGDEKVLDVMFEAAKARLADLRLKDLPTEGSA